MITWIDRELIVAIHDRQIAEHGGASGVRDENLLGSALARPQQLFSYGEPQPDLCELAASLAFGIARNHPFIDGNKRSAWVSCMVFLELNGAELSLASAEDKYLTILSLAEGHLSAEKFAEWLRTNSVSTAQQINEPKTVYASST